MIGTSFAQDFGRPGKLEYRYRCSSHVQALNITVDGMVGTSFAQDFGSKIVGLWSGCTEGETDFSLWDTFEYKGICPTYAYHLGLSDLDNKINIEIMRIFYPKISKMFMRSSRPAL